MTNLRKAALWAAAALMPLVAVPALAAPAGAASYRDLKSVRYGQCVYAYRDPIEGIHLYSCKRTPAKYGNWAITSAGFYNNHPLWIIRRQGGSCLGVDGSVSGPYLFSTCSPTGSRNVWEVFTTTNHRYVLKSFGAYRVWGQHQCLTFPYGGPWIGTPSLGPCSLTNTANQIYR